MGGASGGLHVWIDSPYGSPSAVVKAQCDETHVAQPNIASLLGEKRLNQTGDRTIWERNIYGVAAQNLPKTSTHLLCHHVSCDGSTVIITYGKSFSIKRYTRPLESWVRNPSSDTYCNVGNLHQWHIASSSTHAHPGHDRTHHQPECPVIRLWSRMDPVRRSQRK